ncbi:hypothetical protein [Cohaesibacter celericrescens]|uniref:hypothetical protein n=1 Tax=Cohaesibacter celericrescens TaxID=2067669 RepID=UPI0035624341
MPLYRSIQRLAALVMLFSFAALFIAPTVAYAKPTVSLSNQLDPVKPFIAGPSHDELTKRCRHRHISGTDALASTCGSSACYCLPNTVHIFAGSCVTVWYDDETSLKAEAKRRVLRPPIT